MSAAFKREIQIGQEISHRLTELIGQDSAQRGAMMTQAQVAKKLGLTRPGVARIEYRALYKLQQRLRELIRQDEIYV